MIYEDSAICGFINQSLSGDTLTSNLAISTYWIGRDASGLTFDASNNAVITVGLFLGSNGIGNNGEVLTFATGATGAASFAGNVYVGANGMGNNASVLTFATGATGLATFAGAVTIGGNLLIGANSIGNDAAVISIASGATGLVTLTGGLTADGDLTLNGTTTNHILLPLLNDGVTPTIGFGAGADGFYSGAAGSVDVACGGGGCFTFRSLGLTLGNSGFPALYRETSSSTNPGILPRQGDTDTGYSWAADDALSLVSGGKEMMRLTEGVDTFIEVKAPQIYYGDQFIENFLWNATNYAAVWDLTNVVGAGTNTVKAAAGQGGVVVLTTGGTTGNYECTQTYDVFFSRTITPTAYVNVNLTTDLVGKKVKFGFSDNPMVEDGKYVMFLFDYSADTVNWWSHSADGTDASLATGPTAGTSQKLRLVISAAGVAYFYVDGVLKGTVTGAVSDSTSMYLFFGIETLANNAEAIEVKHVGAGWDF
jgi:hypothetical protein